MDTELRTAIVDDLLKDLKDDGYVIFWTENMYSVEHYSALIAYGGTSYEWAPGDDPLAASNHADVHLQCAIWQAQRHQRKRHALATGDPDVQLYAIDANDFRESVPQDAKICGPRTPVSLRRALLQRLGEVLKAA